MRVHSTLARQTWAKLWYSLRALDPHNSGYCEIPLTHIQELLDCKPSTIYQWLRDGEWAGAFRRWQIRRGILKVFLGGLSKVCLQLGLSPKRKNWSAWGVVAEVPLHQISKFLRPLATVAATQRLQEDSRFAARIALNSKERERITIPYPQEFFKLQTKGTSDNPTEESTGAIQCVLHVGPHRVFTSKGFVPYGCRQITVAESLNYRSDRTVRRHHQLLRLNKRQLVQAKGAYRVIHEMLQDETAVFDNGDFVGGKGTEEVAFCSLRFSYGSEPPERRSTLFEGNGRTSSRHQLSVESNRFFRYYGKTWIYRCNIYEPILKLCSMREREYIFTHGKPSEKAHKEALLTEKGAPACSIQCNLCTTPLKSLQGGGFSVGCISESNNPANSLSGNLAPN